MCRRRSARRQVFLKPAKIKTIWVIWMQTVPALEDPLIIFDTLTEAYVCLDTEFRITFLNKAAEPLLGTTRAELLGKTFWDVCPASTGTSIEEGCYGRAM